MLSAKSLHSCRLSRGDVSIIKSVPLSMCRAQTVCSAKKQQDTNCPDVRCVFTLDPELPAAKLEYVQDAVDTCSVSASPQERKQCFECFGLDSERVDRYYGTVSTWEKLVQQEDEVGYSVVTGGGAGLLWLVAIVLLKV